MSRADYGIVEVELGGKKYELKPTLAALRKIGRKFSTPGDMSRGLRTALESCSSLDPDQLAEIIAIGADIEQAKAKKLPDAIFDAGIVNVLPKVTEYLMLLLDPTGKKDEETEADESGE